MRRRRDGSRGLLRRLLLTTAGAGVVLLLVGSGSSGVQEVTCFGSAATIVGTSGPDVLVGTDGTDVIAGLDGNDRIDARGGDDVVCGGAGDDQILGGDGRDVLFGEAGNDAIDGGTGSLDSVVGGPGNDRLVGNAFAVVVYIGAPAGETVDLAQGMASGGDGTDVVLGFAHIFGSPYDDTLVGNAATNVIFPLGGNDIVRGGGGFDVAGFFLAGGDAADLGTGKASGPAEGNDSLAGVEGLAGNAGNDSFVGDAGRNFLSGGGGDDVIRGGGGSDAIFGGDGNDRLAGEQDNDVIDAGFGANTVDGGPGANDTVEYTGLPGPMGVSVDLLAGTASAIGVRDTLSGIESVAGSAFPDVLEGDNAANGLFGNAGRDSLFGRGGNDFLDGGADFDRADAGPGTGDYCLDDELSIRCELTAKSAAPRRVIAGKLRRLGSLANALCAAQGCAHVEQAPSGRRGGALARSVPLGALVKSYSEPTCKPLPKGGGVTTIAPPQRIIQPGANAVARWHAELFKKGSSAVIARTPLVDGMLIGPAQEPGVPTAWTTTKGQQVFQKKVKRLTVRGVYYWRETVSLVRIGPVSSGKLNAYHQPPGSPSAVRACDFRGAG